MSACDDLGDQHAPCENCGEDHPEGVLDGGWCPSCCDLADDDEADAAFDTTQQEPDAMKLVPVEPDFPMLQAGCNAAWPGEEIVFADEHDGPEQMLTAACRAMLAASPPAPAREGTRIAELEFELSAKTHELAIADEQIERLYARLAALTAREEAPAEGAGEMAVDAWLNEKDGRGIRLHRLVEDLENGADIIPWLRAAYALRDRTSEPEAREISSDHGSIYDQLLTFIHDRDYALRGDERTDPGEIDEAVLEIMKITAAPATADKLRVAKEALEPFAAFGRFEAAVAAQAPDANPAPDDSVFKHWSDAFDMAGPKIVYGDLRRASQAIAALTEEGSK